VTSIIVRRALAKIEAPTKFDTTLRIQKNIIGIQIAMHNVQVMEMCQAVEDLKQVKYYITTRNHTADLG
jgi:hypothetical protein